MVREVLPKPKHRTATRGLIFEAKTRLVTIQLDNSPVFKMHILSANLDGLEHDFGNAQRVDGILGQDILRLLSSIRIDYRNVQSSWLSEGQT